MAENRREGSQVSGSDSCERGLESGLRQRLEEVFNRGLIWASGGVIVIDSRLGRDYPEIDEDFLGALFADYMGQEDDVIKEYVEARGESN